MTLTDKPIVSTKLQCYFLTQTQATLLHMQGVNNEVYRTYSGCAFAGIVNAILSWKFFTPLSRLTYSIYILHVSCLAVYLRRAKSVVHNEDMEKVSAVLNTNEQMLVYIYVWRKTYICFSIIFY
jgi:peptidoglycan/LPS O-acetylase OafA/YrhL